MLLQQGEILRKRANVSQGQQTKHAILQLIFAKFPGVTQLILTLSASNVTEYRGALNMRMAAAFRRKSNFLRGRCGQNL